MKKYLFCLLIVLTIPYGFAQTTGFLDASTFGFSPDASGLANVKALQKAVDRGGTIIVSQPGVYPMAGTVYVGSNTTLDFGDNVFLKKVNEKGTFTHVFLNKGGLTKTYDEHITIRGLSIIVNGQDKAFTEVYGLRGQLAFFYTKDIKIERFRCMDLEPAQFCIHVCTFEDLIIDDVIIKGKKDGIHLGRGKRFTIKNAVFQTFDDAIALNAHDYATSNPELGWIENGLIENCHDLNAENTTGYFCRILAGAWIDWKPGMEVQQSDAVVSNGKLYRVQNKADGTNYKSLTQPTHDKGTVTHEGINWGVVQDDITYTAGVRNVTFRNVFLEKPRIGLSIHFDTDKYSRSYYPGADIPLQEQLTFDQIRVLHDKPIPFVVVATPVNYIAITNSSIRNNGIKFYSNKAMSDYLKTNILIQGSSFDVDGPMELIKNDVAGKEIHLKTFGNMALHKNFKAKIVGDTSQIQVESELVE
ncbi:hypothetical protein CLV98_11911 [Dyadobacter jejuensis]|uniref:Pectate lyase-like protein n=1 Tax=Dyadobacter jejuensis TaxID=1082580 RepID=A0A316AA46_9BACT|nr:hypothetical protein [Dyadobacter jejuensis]PWJ54068.1 hypothetical protein CLV98_11911 [Dyadobacter jejuensis]